MKRKSKFNLPHKWRIIKETTTEKMQECIKCECKKVSAKREEGWNTRYFIGKSAVMKKAPWCLSSSVPTKLEEALVI
ncbi:MAG: hypothetical protein HOP11_03565 [Saprospiraceae bacterium]|nr:hypothetical protein [Saprospiraceae bacterium]